MAIIKMTRKELYDRVWTEPMSRLAKTYGMSDVGLAKLCNRFEIPRPPRGYWAKKEFGQEPPVLPLPNPDQNNQIELRDPSECEIKSPELRFQVEQIVEKEHRHELPILVAETLRGSHTLVSQANEDFQGARPNENGILALPEHAVLALHVSKSSLRRALRIMDAVLKGLEEREYRVAPGPTVTILDATVKFSIEESLEAEREEADDLELEGRYVFGHSRFNKKWIPSGRLVLRIHDADRYWAQGCRKSWRDGEKTKLEGVLNKFVGGLVAFAARIKEHEEAEARKEQERQAEELRREEAARQRAEKRKQYNAERARVETLLDEAKSWRRSQALRDYIEAAKCDHLQRFGTIDPVGDFAQWVEWAIKQADRLDPLRESPPSILDINPKELEEPKRSLW